MTNFREFGHDNPDEQRPFDRAEQAGLSARAENIARGQDDANAVMDAWMDSSGHRRNILNCDLTRLGVGVTPRAAQDHKPVHRGVALIEAPTEWLLINERVPR